MINYFSKYTTLNSQEILKELGLSAAFLSQGLSHVEAKRRLKEFGSNQIGKKGVSAGQIFLRQFKSPFIYLLLFASVLTFFFKETLDTLLILLFVSINAFLGFYQEYRSEQTLKLLKKYQTPKTRVFREGQKHFVESENLAPGDLIILEPGDILPADVRFLSETNLILDESILTGESAPVKKIATLLPCPALEIYQAQNIGFSGTSVVGGKGQGIVLATGQKTIMGEISHLTLETSRTSTFEKGLSEFSQFVLRLILITLILIFLANLLIKGSQANAFELIIFSIALAVSVIPEALPAITTFSLSKGALRLAKNHVAVKRLSAVEDLGSIEILCTDKTGTLTENQLTVDSIYSPQPQVTLLYAVLASSDPNQKSKIPQNSFDLSLQKKLSSTERHLLKQYQRRDEIPFDPEHRRNCVLVKKGTQNLLIVRGASEVALGLCSNLTPLEKQASQNWVAAQGQAGLRVMAVAFKEITPFDHTLPDLEKQIANLNFLGLISLSDPLKKTAAQALKKAQKLGVKIKILTGDAPEVAGSVAFKLGLIPSPQKVVSGAYLDQLDFHALQQVIENECVFARVSPQQKFKIIQALEGNYAVGFLGEGINDAPALKIANVGLVVNEAADIAREAADIVLLQKSLNVIVDGIGEGRKIFANIEKYILATLTSNFGNFYAVATASLLITFLPMLPIQILLLNLLSDFPMISIAMDNVDLEELKKPKSYNIKDFALLATTLGLVSTVFDFIFFALFSKISPGVLQTNWFIGSVLTELLLIFSIRTKNLFILAKRPSATIFIFTILAGLITLTIPFTRSGQELFKFVPPSPIFLITIACLVLSYFCFTEGVKLLYFYFFNHNRHLKS